MGWNVSAVLYLTDFSALPLIGIETTKPFLCAYGLIYFHAKRSRGFKRYFSCLSWVLFFILSASRAPRGRICIELRFSVTALIYNQYTAQCPITFTLLLFLQWGTVGTEIKIASLENPELEKVRLLKPGAGQNIAMNALLAAMNFSLPQFNLPFIFLHPCSCHFSLC